MPSERAPTGTRPPNRSDDGSGRPRQPFVGSRCGRSASVSSREEFTPPFAGGAGARRRRWRTAPARQRGSRPTWIRASASASKRVSLRRGGLCPVVAASCRRRVLPAAGEEFLAHGLAERPEAALGDAGCWSNDHIDSLKGAGHAGCAKRAPVQARARPTSLTPTLPGCGTQPVFEWPVRPRAHPSSLGVRRQATPTTPLAAPGCPLVRRRP